MPLFNNQKEKIRMIRNLSRKKLKPLKKHKQWDDTFTTVAINN